MALPTLLRRLRRTALAGTAIAAALAGLPALTSPALAADVLLSRGRPVTVSSTESAAFPGPAAVDGNLGTRWSSAFADPQWIRVDLGSSLPLSSVVLRWEAAYARAFQVQVSGDGSAWSTVYSTTSGAGGTQTLPVSATGRYIRMYGTQRATQYGYSLWELEVYGPSGGGTEALLSYAKPATASSSQNDAGCRSCTPAKAVDRDPATRWATAAWADPGWISVDLGATATISRVVLQWDPAYARAYQIQVSATSSSWTTVYSTTTGSGFKETLAVSGTGRYVRMYGTQRAGPYGYSLWELQVYGTGGAPTAPPPLPPDVSFPATRLVFSDEFNGPAGSTPDSAKWTAEVGTGQNNELQYYTARNAFADGAGNLVLEARQETTPGSSCPGGPCQYTSARLNTAQGFTFAYGHVEARIKVSDTPGLWPAFWLLGANFPTAGWPACGEIDIMEHLGRIPDTVYSTIHAPAYFGGGGIGAPHTVSGSNFASAFHTYAVDWNASMTRFSVDGNAFLTLAKSTVESTRGPWVFDHPFFLILNNAVGGDWPGPPTGATVFPQRMSVDYVRVYQ